MSLKKRLLIDGQVFQTSAKDRGMGRYAMCLIAALLRKSDYAIEIILTEHLPLGRNDQAELKKMFPGADFVRLDLWTADKHALERAAAHNQATLEAHVATFASPEHQVDYFIPSLFQEPLIAVLPRNVRAKTVLFHDLIPYLYHHRYQAVMLWQNYLKRFKYLFEADLIFTNSQTVADDLHMYLGIPKRKLCRVDGAAIHTDNAVEKPDLTGLESFILFNTSDDPRKNNLRTVLGFEEYRIAANSDVKLVLTSHIGRREQEHLRMFSKHLLFTGSIPERQLNWLYQHCELLLFPPESEGLGLPVLEAVDAGKKVVCSSIPVLQEIDPELEAFYYCDHENSYSIAKALERATAPGANIDQKRYKAIKRYYSWDNSAERMLDGLATFKPTPSKKKPRLALFTAVPSGLSGVGLTAAALHPVLAEHFVIDYYVEKGLSRAEIRPDYLQYVAPCYPAPSFSVQRYQQYDAVVYHLGNGEYHLDSIKNALYLPGYIIVHDTNLREAYRVLRENGMMDQGRVEVEEAIDDANKTQLSNYFTSIANRQLGIITHSDYAKNAMEEVLDAPVPILRANLPTNIPALPNIRKSSKITIGLAGAIADVKGIDVIEAIAEEQEFHDCNIKLFGFNHASQEKIDKLNAYDNVSVATNVSDFDFQTNIRSLHIFVNFRLQYKGETSNTTLEAMRQGVVTIVRNVGWYSELPDDVVIKVDRAEEVFDRLRELVKDPARLTAVGARAKAYVEQHFTQEQYAEALVELFARDQSKNPNHSIAAQLKQGTVTQPGQLLRLVENIHHER